MEAAGPGTPRAGSGHGQIGAERFGKADPRLARTENISMTGMFLHTEGESPSDASVDFEFFIPDDDSHPIRGAASVVRSIASDEGTQVGVAIRFESLLGSDRARLETLLSNADAAT